MLEAVAETSATTVEIVTGTMSNGQGHETVYARMVAEQTGIDWTVAASWRGVVAPAGTPDDVAARLAIDPSKLAQTVQRFNNDAAAGVDRQFGKGSNAYNRYMGDPLHTPNPCLRPLNKPPYHAVRLRPVRGPAWARPRSPGGRESRSGCPPRWGAAGSRTTGGSR